VSKRLPLLIGLVLLAKAATAHADAAFDEAYNKGQDFFNLGKYEDAKAQFEKARDLDPTSPGPYRWIARTSKALQDWDSCVKNAVKSLQIKLDSKYANEIRSDLDACREKLGRPKYEGVIPQGQGALAVISNVEGAAVEVDTIKKGATPLSPFPLNPGKHKLVVSRRGYISKEEEVTVTETIVIDDVVDLAADPNANIDDRIGNPQTTDDIKQGWILIASNVGAKAAIRIDGKILSPGPDGSFTETPGPHQIEVTAPGYEPWHRTVKVARGQKRTVVVKLKSTDELHHQTHAAYWAFGAAALFGATGAAFGLLENSTYEQAQELYETEQTRPMITMIPAGTPEATVHTRADFDALKSKANTYALVADFSFGVAAVALAVSVYYFTEARTGNEEKSSVTHSAFIPTVTPDGHGAQVVYTTELRW
jgi:hypothetical protein